MQVNGSPFSLVASHMCPIVDLEVLILLTFLMYIYSIDLGEKNKLSCYLVHVEHFSESKMAAAAILDMANFHLLVLMT